MSNNSHSSGLDKFVLLIDANHLNRFALATMVIDYILERLAFGVDEPAQMIYNDMVDGTAITLQDHHSTSVGTGIHLFIVPGVAQFTAIDYGQLPVHAFAQFQSPW